MRLNHLRFNVIVPALKILNDLTGKHLMNSHQAQVMLVAIALQESAAKYRRQVHGPARGYWQFEKYGGTAGVMRHSSTGAYSIALMEELNFSPATVDEAWEALPYSEILAAGFARLLLWTDAKPLPAAYPASEDAAWDYYIRNWRPGKPHKDRWAANWQEALKICGDF